MANVNVTSDAWTEISITSGTIQNISATADIELSAEQTDNSGVVLKPSELYQWDNETIYARAVTEETGALRVVNFKRAAGGGGYVLPVASSSTLGGVKVGGGLDIDASGVLSAPVNYSTTEQVIGTWIDGSPLYQLTIYTNTPSAADTIQELFDLDSYNIKLVVDISGIVLQPYLDDTICQPINYTRETNASSYSWFYCGTNYDSDKGFYLKAQVGSVIINSYCYVTIRYTKITD